MLKEWEMLWEHEPIDLRSDNFFEVSQTFMSIFDNLITF